MKKKKEIQADFLTDEITRLVHNSEIEPENLDALQPTLELFNARLISLTPAHPPTIPRWTIQFLASHPNAKRIQEILQHSLSHPPEPEWTGHLGNHPDF